MSTERPHHPFSPSTLQAREASPCWTPTNEENEAAKAGTKQHDAFASGDLSGLADEQAEMVQQCLNYFDRIRATRRRQCEVDEQCIYLSEVYLPVDDDLVFNSATQKEIQSTTAGYIDSAIVSGNKKHADLIDLKFGLWEVEPAETNLQGIAYLLGLALKYPTLESVTVHFLQPYLDSVDVHIFHKKDFPALYLRVKQTVLRAIAWQEDHEQAKYLGDLSEVEWFPTNSTCRFCARLGRCGAAMRLAHHISDKYQPIPLPKQLDPLMVADPKHASEIMKLADLMVLWGAAVRREVTEEAIRSETAPDGYRFVSNSGQPKILNAKQVLEIAEKQFGVTPEQAAEATSITLGPLEAAVEKNTPRGQKSAESKRFREVLEEARAVAKGRPFTYIQQIKNSPIDE